MRTWIDLDDHTERQLKKFTGELDIREALRSFLEKQLANQEMNMGIIISCIKDELLQELKEVIRHA